MSRKLWLGLLTIVGASVTFPGYERATTRTMLRIALTNAELEVPELARDGYDVIVVSPDRSTADVVAPNPDALQHLHAGRWTILKEEPLDGTYGPDAKYKTPEEVAATLADYASRYPDLVTLRSIGKSPEGRDIWAVKLAAESYVDIVSRPAVLFNALHHAREVMSVEVALDTIDYLVTHWRTDERVTRWLSQNDIWVLPMLNVDGSHRVWTDDSMWRKNTRQGFGTDINRNYPYKWRACNGSSGNRNDETYRGEAPASEPETQAMIDFVREIRPVFDISYHSYGELVIYPYGCDGVRTPHDDVVESIGKNLARQIKSDSGRGTYRPGTSWELLYAVDGSDIDWMYHDLHVIPFVIELNNGFGGGGFHPPWRKRDETVASLRAGWGFLLDRLDGPGVRGRVTDAEGRPRPNATVTVSTATRKGLTYPVNGDGTYHVVLDSGRYHLEFSDGDGSKVTRDVTVEAQRKSLSVRF